MSIIKGITPSSIIMLAIAIVVFSAVIPLALGNIFEVNTTAWDPATAALWILLPLVVIALFVTRFSGGLGGKGAS